MDQEKLKKNLAKFVSLAESKGFPLTSVKLEKSFPSWSSSPYNLKISASWIDEEKSQDPLSLLISILFESTDADTRMHIDGILIEPTTTSKMDSVIEIL